jgi:hypothetical protein
MNVLLSIAILNEMGSVTGLRAAPRAGAHVSCATRQESIIVSVYESGITPV